MKMTWLTCSMLLAFLCSNALWANARSSTRELPLTNKVNGHSVIPFDTRGQMEGLRYLGSTMLNNEPTIYAQDYDTNYIYRFSSHGRRTLTEIRGREILGFGVEDDGNFLLFTKGTTQHLIERFSANGQRIYHINVAITLNSEELFHVDFDGDSFYLTGPNNGFKVHRFGGNAVEFEGFPIMTTHEFLQFNFHDKTLEVSFLPNETVHKLRIPLFYPPDHIEFFRNTQRGLYFLLETELNLETFESTFFIYKVDRTRLKLISGLYVNLPYSSRMERFFWFDQEGNIYLTTLDGHSYDVWYVGHF